MKHASTLILKMTLVFMSLVALAMAIFAFPWMGKGMAAEFPVVPYLEYSVVIGYITLIPFFIALHQAFKLLILIDRNTAFSEMSAKALRNIKRCAIAITTLWLMGMPFIFMIAQADDAPGLVIVGMIFACSPIVIAIFAAVLEKLVRNAIEIKSENDLTV